ncbi:MAG: J domain-containing protein [Candidatus Tectomicrobia bacterium]|nr:J domain-containing protein [Candidatus Tectomicrobia bacterium]
MDILARLYSIARSALGAQLERWEASQQRRGVDDRAGRGAGQRRARAAAGEGERAKAGRGASRGAEQAGDPSRRGAYDRHLAQCYANLELPYGADLETARRRWKAMLKKYHPDLHAADPERQRIATQITQEITAAYRAIEQAHARRNR